MKKIITKHPYILIEKIDKEDTETGIVLASPKDTDVFYGKVINCSESSFVNNDDIILFIKDNAYTFVDEGKKYFIIDENEDLIGIVK